MNQLVTKLVTIGEKTCGSLTKKVRLLIYVLIASVNSVVKIWK